MRASPKVNPTGGEMSNQEGGAYHDNSVRWLEFDVEEMR